MSAFEPAAATVAILAGGEGLRLSGRDKGLEPLAGRPLIAHIIDAVGTQAGKRLICANRNGERYAQFAPVCRDAVAGYRGPLAAIATALAVCETQWLLTVPVDCPRPPRDLAQRLGAAVGTARAAVAQVDEHTEPLFALYHRTLAKPAADALASDLPVWRWLEQIGALGVDFSESRACFINLNSDEEFRRWEQQAAQHG